MAEDIEQEPSSRGNNKNQRITLNVSGTRFVTTRRTLLKFPNTRLGTLAKIQEQQHTATKKEFLFDADEDVFREVLRYHRTGEMHVPQNMCQKIFCKQLEYWGINEAVVEDCCRDNDIDELVLEKQFLWFEKGFEPRGELLSWSEHVWFFLTDPRGPYTRSKTAATAWTILYMLATVCQTLNIAIYTLPSNSFLSPSKNLTMAKQLSANFDAPCKGLEHLVHGNFFGMEECLFLFFFIEIIIRSACCPDKSQLFTGFSINLLDLVIASYELLAIGLLLSLGLLNCVPSHKEICYAILIFEVIGVIIVQLRCARLLSYATVFR